MKKILESPGVKFSVRELARKTNLSANAASYSLGYMYKKGMIKLEIIGKTHQYKTNLDNFLSRQWKVLFSLEEIHEAKVIDRILNTNKKIISIVLYGSTAIGLDDESSDIDILVIAETNTQEKRKILSLATGTKRELNISVYTPAEWRKKANVQKAFYETVIIDSIALFGDKPVVL